MTTSSISFELPARILLLLFGFVMVAFFLMQPSLSSSEARKQGERAFENAIPEDVPIKIKIKKEKEKAFKDLQNEKWVREFELELTNTGDKPIYFLYLTLVTDVRVGGERLVFPLVYGRLELGDIVSKATPDDNAIGPGESHVFKIHPGQIRPWEKAVRDKHNPEATKIRAELQSLSFGDGTGYFGNQPYPSGANINQARPPPRASNRVSAQSSDAEAPADFQPQTMSSCNQPVSILPAIFFTSESSNTRGGSSPISVVNSCQFEECVGIIPSPPSVVCHNCPPQNRPTFYSAGDCKQLVSDKMRCEL